jgi:hypothetical protein
MNALSLARACLREKMILGEMRDLEGKSDAMASIEGAAK